MPRVYKRKFDWDEARRLRSEGLSYKTIGDRLGVSDMAVYFAVNDEARERQAKIVSAWQRNSTCPDCGAPSTRTGGSGPRRCMNCRDIRLATSVRESELHCFKCNRWLLDERFPSNKSGRKLRRGRHGMCRECLTEAKRDWRERNPEKQKAYDREYQRTRRRELRWERMTPLQRATSKDGPP